MTEKITVQAWLDDFSPLKVVNKKIPAIIFNSIRLNLIRQNLPLRVSLKQLQCTHCVLDNSAWACIDESQNHRPILAWTNFSVSQRNALDLPIQCDLRLYHNCAGLIMGTALDALFESISQMNKTDSSTPCRVISLPLHEKD